MSGTKSKRTSRTGKKPGRPSKKQQLKQRQKKREIIAEIVSLTSIAVAAILLLSNFGVCGTIGNYIRYFNFGMFGIMAYVFPLVLAIEVILIIKFRDEAWNLAKTISGAVAYILLTMLMHLITMGFDSSDKVISFYAICGEKHSGGGIIGGFLAHWLCVGVGVAGAYIVICVLMLICIVLITEKLVLKDFGSHSRKIYDTAKEDINYHIEERREKKKEERKIARMEKKASGVTTNTKITDHNDLSYNEDMHEITPDYEDTAVYQGHIEYTQEENGQYTYMPKDSSEEEPFTPKEIIEVSEEARAEMARKPFETASVAKEVDNTPVSVKMNTKSVKKYVYPSTRLLTKNIKGKTEVNRNELKETARLLEETLFNFGVKATVTNVNRGPSVTRYELQPEMGTKVSKITSLSDDIKLNMAVKDIRIEAPIPGKAAVGIEVPNEGRDIVYLKDMIESPELKNHPSKLAFAAGKDIAGKIVVADIAKMPHMLVAGTTGSGKSIFTNSIIMTILFRAAPEDVRLLIIDPKVVEFQIYNGIPHLLHPVITDPKKAAGSLNWAVAEMSKRYQTFASYNVRDINGYNEKIESMSDNGDDGADRPEKMPQIVILIDELADLMMVASKDVEEAICRLAQLARAAGIHLIIATQRPSVDVVTGLIKANIPSRVALKVSSGVDSRTIIDSNGAEKLLGNGDMLFFPAGYIKPIRLQGALVTDDERDKVINFIKGHSGSVSYDEEIGKQMTQNSSKGGSSDDDRDELFEDAAREVILKDKGSASMLQRVFKLGFNRAARIIDQLEEAGVIAGDEGGNKPRKVLMTMEELEEYLNRN
ncbi:MAG: DNA translocase FtsK 4TM domain-containing protein [Eubacterium sp.]